MPIFLKRAGRNLPAEVQRWQYFLKKNKFYEGVIDADYGGGTQRSTIAFQKSLNIAQTGELDRLTFSAAQAKGYKDFTFDFYEQHEGFAFPAKPSFSSPQHDKRTNFFGAFKFLVEPQINRADRENIALGKSTRTGNDWTDENIITIDILQMEHVEGYNKRFRCNKKIVSPLVSMFEEWEHEGLLHLILTYSGAFYPRFKRGIENLPRPGMYDSSNATSLSNHSYGSAFDINVAWNGFVYRPQPPTVYEKGSVRLLVPIAHKHGFYWGGHFGGPGRKYDGMHFEYGKF